MSSHMRPICHAHHFRLAWRRAALIPLLAIPALVACTIPTPDGADGADREAPAAPATIAADVAAAADSIAAPAPGTVLTTGDAVHIDPTADAAEDPGRNQEQMGISEGEMSGSPLPPKAPFDVRPFTFTSRDVHDAPMEVSGALVTSPQGWTGQGPRPVLVIAPATAGMADRCAPSGKALEGKPTDPAALEFAHAGWAVVVADYQGLGTPGIHTYAIREAQGHAILDAARAALALDDATAADSPIAITGYSQGGGAAAAAAELAASYAPELDIRGVVSGGAPADLRVVAEHLEGGPLAGIIGYNINALTTAYPELAPTIDGLVNDDGRRFLSAVTDECAMGTLLKHHGATGSELTADGKRLSSHLSGSPELNARVGEQRLGRVAPVMPIFYSHNTADDITPYEQGVAMARQWCEAGADVTFRPVTVVRGPVLNHALAGAATRREQYSFLRAVIAGDPPPASDCGRF